MTIWFQTANGLVAQSDASDPTPPVSIPGCSSALLTPAQLAAWNAIAWPNGGVTFANGAFTAAPVPPPVVPPAPTFTLLPAAGAGATGNVGSGSNDLLMFGTVHAGTTPTAGDVLAVTFGTPRATAPNAVSVGALNVQMGTLIIKNLTASGFTISTTGVPVAGNTYTLWAHVLG